jgi:hypothetical protein
VAGGAVVGDDEGVRVDGVDEVRVAHNVTATVVATSATAARPKVSGDSLESAITSLANWL